MMVYQLSQYCQDRLTAKRFPVSVSYGSGTRRHDAFGGGFVVFERPRGASESIDPPKGAQSNPRRVALRSIAARAIVYAFSSQAGARAQEHEADCDQVVDAVICAILEWARSTQLASVNFSRAGLAGDADLAVSETWPGAVYVVEFSLSRAVQDLAFVAAASGTGGSGGEGGPTGSFAATSLSALVTIDGENTEEVPLTAEDTEEP